MIPFNKPFVTGHEEKYIQESLSNHQISGDGDFTKKTQKLLEDQLSAKKALLTTSCTHALEICAILLDLKEGEEVIVPSYTFTSSALAFVMHGAKITFADIRPDTLNIDENKIENLITEKTRAIVVVHYAGVGCEMDRIMDIANRHNLVVIEDNAHGLFGKYKNKYLGTIGHLATQSFHETKNFTCGEGGALLINDEKYIERAEIIREKGTDRSKFFRGQVDKYTWVDKGSSYVMSDILAAMLLAQLEQAEKIQQRRKTIWYRYYEKLNDWANKNEIGLPFIPDYCEQAYHMFYMLLPSLEKRTRFIKHLKNENIMAVFHYIPLHSSPMGIKCSANKSNCPVTADISERLVRLPFHTGITKDELLLVIEKILAFRL